LSAFALTLGLASFAQPPIEANRATEAQLDGIRGIGPGLSSRIIAARQQAPFSDWNDFIARISGVGPSRAARLSAEGLTIDGQPYPSATPPSPPQSLPNRP
jgi:competence protein ComEA